MEIVLTLLLIVVCILALVSKFCIAVATKWEAEDMLVLILDTMCTVLLVGVSLYYAFS